MSCIIRQLSDPRRHQVAIIMHAVGDRRRGVQVARYRRTHRRRTSMDLLLRRHAKREGGEEPVQLSGRLDWQDAVPADSAVPPTWRPRPSLRKLLPPSANAPSARTYKGMSVTLHTTVGDLKLEVFCESVPQTAENFLALCASGYYDGSPFHRLIPNFMAQTGAPAKPSLPENPKGGRSIWGVAGFDDELRPALRHAARGTVSMANRGPSTNGSQFFVTFDKAPHLDGLNTVFARLIGDDSLATLAKIEAVPVDRKNHPTEPLAIQRVTIHANPLAD